MNARNAALACETNLQRLKNCECGQSIGTHNCYQVGHHSEPHSIEYLIVSSNPSIRITTSILRR